jgi:hypothetical protein
MRNYELRKFAKSRSKICRFSRVAEAEDLVRLETTLLCEGEVFSVEESWLSLIPWLLPEGKHPIKVKKIRASDMSVRWDFFSRHERGVVRSVAEVGCQGAAHPAW